MLAWLNVSSPYQVQGRSRSSEPRAAGEGFLPAAAPGVGEPSAITTAPRNSSVLASEPDVFRAPSVLSFPEDYLLSQEDLQRWRQQLENMSVNGSLLWRTWVEEAWDMWAGEMSMVQRLRPLLLSAYVLSILVSVVGNLLVVVVFHRLHRRPSTLHAYQLNLAASDLCITLLCVPFTLSQVFMDRWIFGNLLCPLILFLQSLSVIVSSYTNVVISIDRFYAVYFPIQSRVTTKNYRKMLLCVWSVGAALSSPQLAVARATTTETHQNQTACLCNEQWQGEGRQQSYTLAFFILVFVLPLLIVLAAYTGIVRRLWSREVPGNAHHTRDARQLSSKRQVTRMLIVIVVLFGFCWMPVHIFHLVVTWSPALLRDLSPHVVESVYFTCHWLAMSHALVNAIVYFVMDAEYRLHIGVIFGCKSRPPPSTSELTRVTTSFRRRSLSSTMRTCPDTNNASVAGTDRLISATTRENSPEPDEEEVFPPPTGPGRLEAVWSPGRRSSAIETFLRDSANGLVHAIGIEPMIGQRPATSLLSVPSKGPREVSAAHLTRTSSDPSMQRPTLYSSVSFDNTLLARDKAKEPVLSVTQGDLPASLQCVQSVTRLMVSIPLIAAPNIEKQLLESLTPSPTTPTTQPLATWYSEARKSPSSSSSSDSFSPTLLGSPECEYSEGKPRFSPSALASSPFTFPVSNHGDEAEKDDDQGIQLAEVTCRIEEPMIR